MLERFHEWRRNRRRQPGLNTADDADRFVADIHAAEPVPEPERAEVPTEPTRTELDLRTPIYDALWRETMARLTAERSTRRSPRWWPIGAVRTAGPGFTRTVRRAPVPARR